jgi:hypothetical protein
MHPVVNTSSATILLIGGMLSQFVGSSVAASDVTVSEFIFGKMPATADRSALVVSPNNLHVAFPVRKGGNAMMFLDGVEGPAFESVGRAVFSTDGNTFAYEARRAGKWVAVVNGRVVANSEGIGLGTLTISPDGKRVAFGTARDGQWRLNVDGKEEPPFNTIYDGSAKFSEDSQRIAYSASSLITAFVMVDGKKQQGFDAILANSFSFSQDSRHFIYGARRAGQQFVVVDGKETTAFDGLADNSLKISADGRRVPPETYRNAPPTATKKPTNPPTTEPKTYQLTKHSNKSV